MTVMLPTFMEVLDTTIVSVSIPHIAGNLSAGIEERACFLINDTNLIIKYLKILPEIR
jgi:DHA2 family multidrug resistance protein